MTSISPYDNISLMQLELLTINELKRLELKFSTGYRNGLALLVIENENRISKANEQYLISYYRGEVL